MENRNYQQSGILYPCANLKCRRKYQMRKTQMSAMLTALAKKQSGGLTFVYFDNEGKVE